MGPPFVECSYCQGVVSCVLDYSCQGPASISGHSIKSPLFSHSSKPLLLSCCEPPLFSSSRKPLLLSCCKPFLFSNSSKPRLLSCCKLPLFSNSSTPLLLSSQLFLLQVILFSLISSLLLCSDY